jgi:small subunit ribosomal protein S6
MSARTYELIYILKPESTEQEVADLQTQVEGIVQRLGGTIEKTDPWGRRKLAYEIGKHKEGVYVLHVIQGSGELMKEIDRRLKVMDNLIRHLIVRVDERQMVAERARTKRQEESRRRRVARGLPPDRQPGEGPQHDNDDDGDSTYDSADGEA